MQITLDYGKAGLDVEVPDRNLVGPLQLRTVPVLSDPPRALDEALSSPIGTPLLFELARGKRSAA